MDFMLCQDYPPQAEAYATKDELGVKYFHV
jgi:hypothetical protein